MSDQVCAGNVLEDNTAVPGYRTWLSSLSLGGTDVIMAKVDQGVDQGHPDLAGQVLSCIGATCGGDVSSSHGTHTAAIQSGVGFAGVDGGGFLRGLGMAPESRLIEQLYSPFFLEPGGMLLLIEESYANNATLSNNSWGPSGSPRGYDNDTMQTDIGVRDADPNAAGDQQFTYVLSIMNGNGGNSSQGTPDEAKNLITVGSTKMRMIDGTQILDINDLSFNSGHGPALDGRHIPHIVAPGCRVESAVPTGWGLKCGTSMASPHVSGSAALLTEQWRAIRGVDPSPAMIKAEILVAARDLAGSLDADGQVMGHRFDSRQGWGRLDTAAVLDPPNRKAVFDTPIILEETGQEWIYTLAVDNRSKPVRVMLVWTDAPGHGLGGTTPAWNNDLDLLVESASETYSGNNFGPTGWSVPGFAADAMNNTEAVFLSPTTDSELTIRVRASNLNSDGVPDHPHPTDQDFALVALNTVQAPCLPGTNFHGGLGVVEAVVDGALTFEIDWSPATPHCGGEILYQVKEASVFIPGWPVLDTVSTSVRLIGAAPGSSYCFRVDSGEDGFPGQGSGKTCVVGSGERRAGDLDCDGEISAVDVTNQIAVIFGSSEPTCAGYPAGDANLDGAIDSADAAQLIRAIHDPL
jgi:hypothetical protein